MNVPLNAKSSLGEPTALKVRTSKGSHTNRNPLSGPLLRRDGTASLAALRSVLLVACSLLLGSCSSVSSYVSDSWPTWAGGMPKDVPPRPGAPGYEEFLAHQQRQDPGAPPSADANAQPTSVVASPSKAGGRTPATSQPMDISGGAPGGLY
jgi:hypothetical protein